MTVAAIAEDDLELLLSPAFRERWAAELPVCRRPVDEITAALATTGLLGPQDSVYKVSVSGSVCYAEAYAVGDTPDARTLSVGLATPTDADTDVASHALRELVTHLMRTTAIVTVERLVDPSDDAASKACREAGLHAHGSRTVSDAPDGLPREQSVFAASRQPRPSNTGQTTRPISRIAILTGGGDAPGLNAVIRAAVKSAVGIHGWEVLGIEEGFEGLLGSVAPRRLTPDDVRGLLPRGGTILGTASKGAFNYHRDESGVARPPLDAVDRAIAALDRLGVDALVAIGGDGTQSIAALFADRGVRVVGVPKTIDNDLEGTDQTFGFATAVALATDALDRLHTTGESHHRVMILEVMGRSAGWIALHSAIAGGADVVLIPEIPFSFDRVAEAIRRRDRAGRKFSIVVVVPNSGLAITVLPPHRGSK